MAATALVYDRAVAQNKNKKMRPPIPIAGYRALRAHRVSLPGHAYLVTTTTHERRRLFADFQTARVAVNALKDPATLGESTVIVWVLMPDHLHVLLKLGENDELSAAMNRIKSRIGRHVNAWLRRSGRVWQCGYHERALRREDDIKAIARYVILNPVRAGLVSRVSDYSHWDASWV